MQLLASLRSEWIKFRSVRSTLLSLVATVVICVGFGAIACFAIRTQFASFTGVQRAAFDPTASSLAGFFFAEIAIGVVGILIITSEYSSGLIRATFAATPRRTLVLISKAVILLLVTLVIGEICSFLSFFIGQAILHGATPTVTLALPAARRAVLLAGLSIALLALLALGIGAILRHTAGAITVYVTLLLVLLLIALALPSSWNHHIYKWLPGVLAEEMQSTNSAASTTQYGIVFSPIVSTIVLACYSLASLVIASVVLVTRDA